MNSGLLIGIDGGATHSTAVAAWPDGRITAVAHGEGMNFNNVGVERVRSRLESVVHELNEKANSVSSHVCVGSAALDAPADPPTLARFSGIPGIETLDMQSDAYIALMGLTRGESGMIAICGTGSMLMLADSEGNQHISGGWGYLMDDAGSGYVIARQGLLAAISAYEGVGPATPLTAHALEYFGVSDLREVINRLYAPAFTPDMLAGFARHVLTEAENGNDGCTAIITATMAQLAYQAAELFKKAPGAVHTGLYGGIFAHSVIARDAFTNALLARMPEAIICAPEYPPELGAIIHLMQKHGLLTKAALENLKTTYERLRK